MTDRRGTRAAASCRRRRTDRERGAGLVEYIGLVLVLGMSLAVSGGLASGLAEGGLVSKVRQGVCAGMAKAVENLGIDAEDICAGLGSNGSTDQTKLPRCITYQQDRLMSGNIDFRFIRGEVTGKDQIINFVDPATGEESSWVILGNEGGLGVEGMTGKAGSFFAGKGLSASGKVMLQGGTGAVYSFDSHEEAQQFLDDHRGNTFKRVLGAIPGASAVEGLWQGGKELVGNLFGSDDEDDDSDPAPSGVVANLGLQAEGEISYQGGSLPGIKSDAVGLKGLVNASGRTSGQVMYNFDGTSMLTMRYAGEIGLEGGVGASRSLTKKYPWLENLGITGGRNFSGAVQYRIRFDENFNPTSFQLRIEKGQAWSGTAGNSSSNANYTNGTETINTYTLDLTDPENREAVMETLPWIAASSLSGAAGPVGLVTTDNPLSRRLIENSIEYEQNFETEGNKLAAHSPHSGRESGLKIAGFGFGGNDETWNRTLTSTRYIDHNQPDATWQELENCNG